MELARFSGRIVVSFLDLIIAEHTPYIWRAFGLQLHRAETFKVSTDPLFIGKIRDIVGLYLNPSDRALVLRVDEKSQILALDRTQPIVPMMPGVPNSTVLESNIIHGIVPESSITARGRCGQDSGRSI